MVGISQNRFIGNHSIYYTDTQIEQRFECIQIVSMRLNLFQLGYKRVKFESMSRFKGQMSIKNAGVSVSISRWNSKAGQKAV